MRRRATTYRSSCSSPRLIRQRTLATPRKARSEAHSAVETGFSVAEATERLQAAIEEKQNKPNYSLDQKRSLIVLLNAEFVPGTTDQRVQEAMSDQLLSSDSQAIFIVGPSLDRVHRLSKGFCSESDGHQLLGSRPPS